MNRFPMVALALSMLGLSMAGGAMEDVQEEKKWWQLRHERSDLYYPHNLHQGVMEKRGDPCMRCHPFTPTDIADPELLAAVNTIANEPLEAICHECHVEERSAPAECDLCHTDPGTIRPADHHADYARRHGSDAAVAGAACSECHVDLSFCTDCHFRRDATFGPMHPPGYRSSHGLEARSAPAGCGQCHGIGFCAECHGGGMR